MPAARGVKRSASKATGSVPHKIKKKHGVQLEVPVRSSLRGKVLSCGQGDVGQLGLGEDVPETARFQFVSTLGENIVDVCAGGMHTVALDSDGKVWTFGCNDEGALGRAGEEHAAGGVALPAPAVAVSAGDSHTAALLDTGDVYLWGAFRDSHGSMGLVASGRDGKSCAAPVRASLAEPAAAIASGGDHLVVLTKSGAVYTCGCGEQGQLGRLAQRSASRHARSGLCALLQPAAVALKAGAARVWAGAHATLALPADRAAAPLAWGLNNHNQLGVTGEKKRTAIYAPVDADAFAAVEDVGTWTQVSCGQHHSLAVDDSGRCYAVGRHDYGRLGLGEGSGDSEALAAVPGLAGKRCASVAAAQSSSFAVTHNGEVYAWGMGSEGQLGTGCDSDEAAPRFVETCIRAPHRVVKVSAGGQHTLLLAVNTEEGDSKSAAAAAATDKKQGAEPRDSRKPSRQASADEHTAPLARQAEAMEVDAQAKPHKKLNGDDETATSMDTDEAGKPQDHAEEALKAPDSKLGEEAANPEDECNMEVEQPEPQPAPADGPVKTETDETPKEMSAPAETESVRKETETVRKETETVSKETETVLKETETVTKLTGISKAVETRNIETVLNGESATTNETTENPCEVAEVAAEAL